MTGVVVGLAFGVGVLLVARGWRQTQPTPPLLAALRKVPAHAPAPQLANSMLSPVFEHVARLVGGRQSIERRLRLAGDQRGVEGYLLQQVVWAGTFAACALLLLLLSGAAQRTAPALVVTVLATVGGVLFGDYLLGRRVAARRARIAEQFPVAAQLLALLVAAGTAPLQAVGRVGSAIGGPLGLELSAAAGRAAAGQGFGAAMRGFADATDLPVIERFVYGLLSAIERGSPLSDIMRAQALDAASESHRALMVAAGRKDIAMLVPVVFAVLPTVVMVCLLPGAVQLGLVSG